VSAFEDLVPPNACQFNSAPEGLNQPSASAFGLVLLGCRLRRHACRRPARRTVSNRDRTRSIGQSRCGFVQRCCGTNLDFGAARHVSHQRCSSANNSFRRPAKTDHSSVVLVSPMIRRGRCTLSPVADTRCTRACGPERICGPRGGGSMSCLLCQLQALIWADSSAVASSVLLRLTRLVTMS
jgi:hypothetical protein